ncbi:YdcF family protein [Bacteroides sp.]
MFFELSKFLNFFLTSPISWIFILLTGVCLCKRKHRKRVCLICCITVFIVFTNKLSADYVRYLAVKEYSTAVISPSKNYELAIVMGGFGSMNKETGQMKYELDRADRLWEAVRLWRKGRVKRILITGDPTSVIQPDGTSTKELFLQYMEEMGIPKETFILEQQARNTRENAIFTAEILKKKEIEDKECLLITSVSHMKRSLACFKKTGIHPDYLPVNIYSAPESVSHRAFYPQWEAAIEWQELMNEWLGDLAYRIMGYV